MGLLDILRRPATTAAELRTKLEALDQEAAEAAVAAAEAARREALLGGTDKDVDKAEAALTAAHRELDRLVAAREELAARIPAAEIAERDAALIAERAEIETEADAIKAEFKARWPSLVAEAVAMLERLQEIERRAERFGLRLASDEFRGQTLPVHGFSHPITFRLGLHDGEWHQHAGILKNTRLLPVPGGSLGWN